jgi:nitroreductase
MYLNAIPKQMKMIMDAPVVIVVVYKPKTPVHEAKKVYDLNCLASVWAAIENLLLTLTESKILGVTYVPKDTPAVKQALSIPKELEIAAVIPIGYRNPYRDKILPKKEIDINQRIHWNEW